MSIICMTHHNESIYETAKPLLPYQKKSDKYTSKFRRIINCEKQYNQKGIKKHESMGLPEGEPPKTSEYLKKNARKPSIKQNIENGKRSPITLPEIPLRNEVLKEQDEKLKHKEKDFITINVNHAITMPPKIPKRRIVVERFGEAKLLERGLEPKYISSKVFGRTPNYLKKEIRIREKLMQTQKDVVGLHQPKCRYITRDEREKLLEGLKLNWEELQKQYQGLPIMTDTIPKIIRKSKLEADLKQLEKDIVLVERHPYIYVYDDEDI